MELAIQKLLVDFSSWYWWLTAVGLAIVLNVVSAIIKINLDDFFAKRKWRASKRRKERTEALHRQAIEMAAQYRVLQFEFQRETRMWLLASFLVIAALVAISSIALLHALLAPASEWQIKLLYAIGWGASLLIIFSFLVVRELFWQVQKTFHAKELLMENSLEDLRKLADEEHRQYYRLPENWNRYWPK